MYYSLSLNMKNCVKICQLAHGNDSLVTVPCGKFIVATGLIQQGSDKSNPNHNKYLYNIIQ